MSKPEFLDKLICKASAAAGSDYKLAAELGVSRGNIGDWKAGRRSCPAGDVALMAQLAGMDPEAWLVRATVAQYAGTPKGEKLAVVLGKALLVTGAALAGSGANAGTAMVEAYGHFIRCIESLSYKPHHANAF